MEAKVRLLSPLERALQFRKSDMMSELSPAELALTAQYAEERSFRRGDRVSQVGERVDSVHFIVDGQVRVRGAEYGECVLGPSEMLGLLSMLSRSEEGLEAVAEADTLTLAVEYHVMEEIFQTDFTRYYKLVREIARKMLAEADRIPDGAYLAPAQGPQPDTSQELGLITRLQYLRNAGIFDRGNMDAFLEMATHAEEIRFNTGSILWRAGETPGGAFVVVAGTLRCALAAGRHFRAGPGFAAGLLESLCDQPHWYGASAETDLVTLRYELQAAVDILEDNFEMAMEFLATLAGRAILLRRGGRGEPISSSRSGIA